MPATHSDAASAPQSEWLSRQVQAMASAWSRGEHLTAEELMAAHPGLGDEAAIRLIYEEVCLRRESGDDVATGEVLNRFPRWKDELEVLLGCDRMLRPFSRVALFPGVGENLGPFRLLAELGRGASGKTYLAAEPALGNRLIVLKVITDDQEEHLSLARLRHTHIIPLFSEQSFPDRGLRALCMPYLGGASLARIFDGLAGIAPADRRGRHILEVLDRMPAVAPPGASLTDGPFRRYLAQATYVQAICWIAACLADALQGAHAHALIHMDVKPSNVLIAGDGLPLLLDFHLAHRPIRAGERIADRLGGTPGWMAPEHRAALDAVRQGDPVPAAIDGRSDIFALGLLMREALADPATAVARGRGPGEPGGARNPEISVGLADIVAKCLATDPADRYRDAALLADDLRRHLNDLPLHGVANRSPIERWRKWRRRRPAALVWGLALLAMGAAMVAGLFFAQAAYSQRVREIDSALQDGRKLCDERRFPEAVQMLKRGLVSARGVPGVDDLRGSLSHQLVMAQRGQRAAALHDLADLTRFRYGIDLPAPAEARRLIESTRSLWNDRDLLKGAGVGTLDSRSEQAIRADLLDLTITAAELLLGLARGTDGDAARQDAVRLLDLANTWCGPSARLDRLRGSQAGAASESGSGGEHGDRALSALDHFDVGRAQLRAGRFREAAFEFQQILDDRPQDFWPNFYQGLCAYRLGQFREADAAFRTCLALAPDSAECHYNRARVAEALGRTDQALRAYTRAVELDPALTAAWMNRGVLAYKSDRTDAAIADLRQALRSASDGATAGLIHYNLALAYLAAGDRASARNSAHEAVSRGHSAARALSDRLQREP